GAGRQRLYQRLCNRSAAARRQALRNRCRHVRDPAHADRPGTVRGDCVMTDVTRDPIVIAAAVRTPMGGFQDDLAPMTASGLGAAAIREAVARAGVRGEEVAALLMGCGLPAGQGRAPARQAAMAAGLP